MNSATESNKGMNREALRGFVESMPVMIGFVPFALVLGAQAVQKGLSPWEVPLMTGLNFGGGSEFAAVELWTSPPNVTLIVLVTLLINSRHLLMGATLAPLMRSWPKRKALPALFFMCDESWAMGISDAHRRSTELRGNSFSLPYYLGVSAGLYVTWVVMTTIGGLIGPVLGDIEAYGLDMAFPAVFLVLLSGMWKGVASAKPWMVSLIAAGLTHVFIPGVWYVASGVIFGLIAAWIWTGRA